MSAQATDVPGGSDGLSREEALALAQWLARVVQDMDDCRGTAMSLPAEQCKHHLIMHFPILQGLRNQMALADFSRKAVDEPSLRGAVTKLLAATRLDRPVDESTRDSAAGPA